MGTSPAGSSDTILVEGTTAPIPTGESRADRAESPTRFRRGLGVHRAVSDFSWVVDDLRQILTRLASGPDAQLQYLASLGRDRVAPGVDELALELDDVAPMLPQVVTAGHLTNQGAQAVEAVSDRLARMSGQKHAELWTPDALRTSDEWSSVRRLASEALQHLGDAT